MIIKLKDASQNKSFIMLCDSLDTEPVIKLIFLKLDSVEMKVKKMSLEYKLTIRLFYGKKTVI